MQTNTILALIIVLIFILGFIAWVLAVVLTLLDSPSDALGVFVPGAIIFGFWGSVAWRLYNCPGNSLGQDLGFESEKK
jgi:hypothetical protein